jgi:hypothetical protein
MMSIDRAIFSKLWKQRQQRMNVAQAIAAVLAVAFVVGVYMGYHS